MMKKRTAIFGTCAVISILAGVMIGRASSSAQRPPAFGGKARNNIYLTAFPDQTTTSTEFTPVTGLGPFMLARGGLTADVSLTVDGGPVELRMTTHGEPMWPGVAAFDATGGPRSLSYTFGIGTKGDACYWPRVEWRSPSGAPLTLDNAALHIITNKPKDPRIRCID